jgi:hypothetical protein
MALLESLKLPDILKASATQALALAVACAAILYLSKIGLLPALEAWMVLAAAFVGIFAGALWAALVVRETVKLIDIRTRWGRWQRKKGRRKAVADYIPHMNVHEREIIGYLLERNEKSFDCAADGGYAATLLGRGMLVRTLQPGQVFDMEHVPMTVPDDVWDVLSEHRDQFPANYEGEAHPWRVPWMAR